MKILSIESSCDETAAAVVEDGKAVLSSVVASQIEIHRRFGGVVPEIASRNHTLAVGPVVDEALARAGLTLDGVDAIAVTYGAGLLGALLVGVSYAKALAYAANKPLYAVSHIKGHIAANYIAHDEVKPPYVCLLVSGGHSALLRVDGYDDFSLLGTTRDDAAGEAFDKVARVLGLPYPGGPEIEKLAATFSGELSESCYKLPKPVVKGTTDFSFSGLKTAVINCLNNAKNRGETPDRAQLAAVFQETAVDGLVENAVAVMESTGLKTLTVAGGVSANSRLRQKLKEGAAGKFSVFYPPLSLCTDNAEMIGAAAYYMSVSGAPTADLTLDASANVPLT